MIILASKDTSTTHSETNSIGMNMSTTADATGMGASLPTANGGHSTTDSSSTTYNNSTINSANEITITAKGEDGKADIAIEGATITAENDIDLNAENGDITIASNQNTNQSNTNGSNWGVGGTMSYGQNKENIDQVKNNYTTITSRKGKTNINTNDLTLTGIQRDSGNDNNTNNFNTDKVRGKIRENTLTEKNENYSESWNVAFNLPINIVRKNFKPKDGTIPTEDPNKVPVKQGDWKGALANTTFTYQNSDGYDYSVSPASLRRTIQIAGSVVELIPGNPIDVSRNKDIPPHPFPSLGIGDEVMGRSTVERDENNMPIIRYDENGTPYYTSTGEDKGGFVSNLLSGGDKNPALRILYAFLLTGKSNTDNHDIESNRMVKEMLENGASEQEIKKKLATTIPTSFGGTIYGIFGTILDAKNYETNLKEIIKSYDNGLQKNIEVRPPKNADN